MADTGFEEGRGVLMGNFLSERIKKVRSSAAKGEGCARPLLNIVRHWYIMYS